ncbi:MAG: dTDP-4-amino-4,6-dideoxygalactose transaminase [Candidatus Aminicenantes bacterium]|nr:dTDP-4-amino-4,6-dideoxygalactose transaminase [Candidatus Aminicenantes bacterium]
MIPFNRPYLTGKETRYIKQAVLSGKISGNGLFTSKCHQFFEREYGFKKVLLTTSCTDALEMAALLIDVCPDDEIIVPSFTFVSTANAFVMRGAKIVFVDSSEQSPHLNADLIESFITSKTKAIVPVHYAGIACDMEKIMSLAERYCLFVIEDVAHSVDSFYKGKPLGSIGHLAAFSFHETKNVIAGEGGMLAVNDDRFAKRAEIIWEKGTNRAEFFRGEVDKYGWVDVGSSFLPSEITAAFLFAQLENMDRIQEKRKKIWEQYHTGLKPLEDLGLLRLPKIPDYATKNGHLFYIICRTLAERDGLLSHLRAKDILAVFHYLSLHTSPFYRNRHDGRKLRWSDFYSQNLIRLPLFYELSDKQVNYIVQSVLDFFSDY